MAGPAWRTIEQPVFRNSKALVVVLDLSLSMDVADIKPSRLERVKLKLLDIFKQRQDGQTGLVVFAANPYVVSPLTPDTATISLQIKSLDTDLMPAKGSRPDRALAKAVELIKQGGAGQADILLVTDGLGGRQVSALVQEVDGHRLSVLGVGTPEGGPVPDSEQGFVKDRSGGIVLARLDESSLRQLALAAGGRYHRISSNDQDVEYLVAPLQEFGVQGANEEEHLQTEQWQEEGPWLVLFILPLVALVFRRGVLVLIFFLFFALPQPASAFEWVDLWSRRDQQGARAFAADKADEAAALFKDPGWRAAAQYRVGDYEQTLQALEGSDSSQAEYNRGNALARLGRLEEALAAYEKTLEKEPGHQDAIHNRDLVRKAFEQQKQQQDQQQRQNEKKQGQQEDSERNQDQKGQQGDDSEPESEEKADQQRDNEGEGKRKGEEDTEQSATDENEQPPASSEMKQEEKSGKQAEVDEGEEDEESTRPGQVDEEGEKKKHQELEQWLRRIPDDPGGLWRRKFRYQYQQQYQRHKEEEQSW